MCGIAGFAFLHGAPLEEMTDRLAHRGPDDRGFFRGPRVGLGHRRLGIVDPAGGRQPFVSEGGNLAVVCNGEIYNHLSLRSWLEGRGHRFRTSSDNEVLLHLYEEHRDLSFLSELNGMFAFAIWDGDRQLLHLVRDRHGIRPLYFSVVGEGVVFGSEVKALLAHPQVGREVSDDALQLYLSLRYVPGEQTLLRSVRRLAPASWMSFSPEGRSTGRYWRVPGEREVGRRPLRTAARELRWLLEDSTRMQLMADVPVGAYLSGGMDSSCVTALAARASTRELSSFCVGFGSQGDETEQAKEAAAAYGTSHSEVIIGPEDFRQLPRIVWHMDDIFGDPIAVPMFRLAAHASERVKVVITGEGADELFGGYIHHRVLGLMGELRGVPGSGAAAGLLGRWLPKVPGWLLEGAFPYPAVLGEGGRKRLARLLGEWSDPAGAQAVLSSLFTPDELGEMAGPGFPDSSGVGGLLREIWERVPDGVETGLNGIIRSDLAYWLPDYILNLDDRTCLAHGVESRVPYLDHRIVEMAMGLPADQKVSWRERKRVLGAAAAGIFPLSSGVPSVKRPFYVPLEEYFDRGFKDCVERWLTPSVLKARGLVEPKFVQGLLARFDSAPLLYGKQLHALVVLELWLQTFVDGDGSGPVG